MTLPPKDYLRARRKDITAQIQALNEELRDLDRMESALTGQGSLTLATANLASAVPVEYRATPEEMERLSRRQRRRFEMGIKAMGLQVLASMNQDVPAMQIIELIKDSFGVSLVRTSLSPQLSRLKDEGLVELTDKGWRITVQGLENLHNMKPQTPGEG
jgi:aspartate aminotransferase-like enzyme